MRRYPDQLTAFLEPAGPVGFPFPVQLPDIPVRKFDKVCFPALGLERISRCPPAPPVRMDCQRFIKQCRNDWNLVPDPFNSAACLSHIIGKIHGFGFFDKLRKKGTDLFFEPMEAEKRIEKIKINLSPFSSPLFLIALSERRWQGNLGNAFRQRINMPQLFHKRHLQPYLIQIIRIVYLQSRRLAGQ
jgi:hypothetical protein